VNFSFGQYDFGTIFVVYIVNNQTNKIMKQLTLSKTNAMLKRVFDKDNATTMRKLLSDNRKILNSDGYLSFEEVFSVELTESEEKTFGYKWIDGVQIFRRKLYVWVSTDNSVDIYSISADRVPQDEWEYLFNKVFNAIEYYSK